MTLRDAYKAMIKSLRSNWDGMAHELGMTTDALRNRVYGVKGQALSVNDSLEMQVISGRTDFAEAIAQMSGGTFVRLPDMPDMDNESLDRKFKDLYAKVGRLAQRHNEATEDGEVDSAERKDLTDITDEIHQSMQELLALTFRIYCRDDSKTSAKP
jgi:hypothetical protein